MNPVLFKALFHSPRLIAVLPKRVSRIRYFIRAGFGVQNTFSSIGYSPGTHRDNHPQIKDYGNHIEQSAPQPYYA